MMGLNTLCVGTLLTCSETVKNPVFPQYRVTVGADKHSCLRISEDVVFLQQTFGHTTVL